MSVVAINTAKFGPKLKLNENVLQFHAIITCRSEMWSRALLTLGLDESGQLHAPATLLPRTEPLVSTQ